MKQIGLTLVGLLLTLTSITANATLNVLACEPEWKSLVEMLGGEDVEVYSATTAFQDPHYIEARPSLIAKTRQADLIVCTGAELEIGWLPLLLRQSGNAAIQAGEMGYFLAAEQVERIEIPKRLDRDQGDVHASGNPHVHWDPYRLRTIANQLAERLSQLDPEMAHKYQDRYQTFEKQWDQKIQLWEEQAAHLKGQKVIVYHKHWSYLLQWLGVDVVGDLEPKPGIPPTSSHLASLLETARSKSLDFILISNYQDDKGARWLNQKAGTPIMKLPFTVGGLDEASLDEANDLISLYDLVITSLSNGTNVSNGTTHETIHETTHETKKR